MGAHDSVEDVFLMDAGRLGNEVLEPLDRIRESDPIFWSDKSHCWFITRHEDILRGFSGELPLSAHRLGIFSLSSIPVEEQPARIPYLLRYAPHMSIDTDPPEHTRLRKLLVKAFSRKVVEDTRPFVKAKVQELIDRIGTAGNRAEFVEEIARPLPGSVILHLLGLPSDYLPYMKDWANSFVGALASARPPLPLLDEAERVTKHMAEVAAVELTKRRESPQSDLLTALLKAHEEEDRLSEDELIGTLMLLIVAGHDTTSNSMTLILATLAEHPECWDYMYQNPERIYACIDELMRYIAMSFVQPRIAVGDFNWHGKEIKAGQIVMLLQGVGNRDPRAYAAPAEINFDRSNDSVLTFGPGLHHCLGHLLAKMQLAEFFSALVKQYAGVKIVDERLDFMPQIGFRGLYGLNARFIPR